MPGSLQAARRATELLIALTGQVAEDDLVEALFGNQIFAEKRLPRRRLSLEVSSREGWRTALGRVRGELSGLVVLGHNTRFDLVECAAHQMPQHLLVLLLHQLPNDFRKMLGAHNVRVRGALRGDNVTAHEEMRDDVSMGDARILRLHVIHLPLVIDVVIETGESLLEVSSHGPVPKSIGQRSG